MRNLAVLILALATIVGISSCNSGAMAFNNKMVEKQKALEPKVTALGKKMEALGDSGDFKLVAADAKLLIEGLDKDIADIKALEAPKNGEEFKRAVLAQFEHVKKFCTQTIKLGDESTSSEEKLKIAADFMKVGEEATKLEEDMINKQKEFAKANGFKVQ